MSSVRSGPSELGWDTYVGDGNLETFQLIGEAPVDLTGAVIAAQARTTAKATTVAVAATVTVTDAVNGYFTVGWDGEELRTLVDAEQGDTFTGVWDLQITLDGEEPKTWLAGTFTATYDVTR